MWTKVDLPPKAIPGLARTRCPEPLNLPSDSKNSHWPVYIKHGSVYSGVDNLGYNARRPQEEGVPL